MGPEAVEGVTVRLEETGAEGHVEAWLEEGEAKVDPATGRIEFSFGFEVRALAGLGPRHWMAMGRALVEEARRAAQDVGARDP